MCNLHWSLPVYRMTLRWESEICWFWWSSVRVIHATMWLYGQVPAKPNYSMVLYFAAEKPIQPGSLLDQFANGDDAFRNSRFKLIPSIVEVFFKYFISVYLNVMLVLVYLLFCMIFTKYFVSLPSLLITTLLCSQIYLIIYTFNVLKLLTILSSSRGIGWWSVLLVPKHAYWVKLSLVRTCGKTTSLRYLYSLDQSTTYRSFHPQSSTVFLLFIVGRPLKGQESWWRSSQCCLHVVESSNQL